MREPAMHTGYFLSACGLALLANDYALAGFGCVVGSNIVLLGAGVIYKLTAVAAWSAVFGGLAARGMWNAWPV